MRPPPFNTLTASDSACSRPASVGMLVKVTLLTRMSNDSDAKRRERAFASTRLTRAVRQYAGSHMVASTAASISSSAASRPSPWSRASRATAMAIRREITRRSVSGG